MSFETDRVKNIIEVKVSYLILLGIVIYFVGFFFEYDFNNQIYNAILLYLLAQFVSIFFTLGSLSLYIDTEVENWKFDTKEFHQQELRLRFNHPKLFVYNRIVFGIYLIMKMMAWMLLVYGIGLYFLT